jgi:hypothetical protein
MPPPASAPPKSSPVGKIGPDFIQHKRDQVQAFDDKVQRLEPFTTPEEFLEYFRVDQQHASEIPDSPRDFSIDNFCNLANDIARSIKARGEHHLLYIYLFLMTYDFSLDFPNRDLLVFKDTGKNTRWTRYGHNVQARYHCSL